MTVHVGAEPPPRAVQFPCGCLVIPLVDVDEKVVGVMPCWEGCAVWPMVIAECLAADINVQRVEP